MVAAAAAAAAASISSFIVAETAAGTGVAAVIATADVFDIDAADSVAADVVAAIAVMLETPSEMTEELGFGLAGVDADARKGEIPAPKEEQGDAK